MIGGEIKEDQVCIILLCSVYGHWKAISAMGCSDKCENACIGPGLGEILFLIDRSGRNSEEHDFRKHE